MKPLSNTRKANLDTPALRRPSQCPVEDWLGFLGHRWNALLLWHLSSGAKRHGELMACLPGMTPKVMTERLEGLETRLRSAANSWSPFWIRSKFGRSWKGIKLRYGVCSSSNHGIMNTGPAAAPLSF
jgi:hypothetical protein